MMIQRRIPVFFRLPLALLTDAVIALGPLVAGLFWRPASIPVFGVVVPGALWIVYFDRCLLWRLDCFWNLKTMQNRTDKPESPDNERRFKTVKGWSAWLLLGRDVES